MSRVDVVIPCYKYAQYLRGCVESVLEQPGVEVRVLIIDDCSPDNTPEVAAQLVADYSGRVEYRRHAVNQGHIATYNEGLLGWAQGDYCLLLSADDMLTPGSLRRAVGLLDAHPEVALVYGRDVKTDKPGEVSCTSPTADCPVEVMSSLEFLERSCLEADNIVPTPTAVVRTSLQKAVGGYRRELPHTADMEMWLRIAAHASVGRIDADQAFYRTHAAQMSVGYAGTRDLLGRRAAFDTVFSECAARIPQHDRLQRLAARCLSEMAFWRASALFDAGQVERMDEFLRLAVDTDPSIRRRPLWWRLVAKRAVGPKACSVLLPLLRAIRGGRPRRAVVAAG